MIRCVYSYIAAITCLINHAPAVELTPPPWVATLSEAERHEIAAKQQLHAIEFRLDKVKADPQSTENEIFAAKKLCKQQTKQLLQDLNDPWSDFAFRLHSMFEPDRADEYLTYWQNIKAQTPADRKDFHWLAKKK